MKKLIYIISCILLTACNDDVCTTNGTDAGAAMRFEAIVIDQPEGRGMVLNVNDNDITRDFKPGESFGLFIIDGNDNFVTEIDGKTFYLSHGDACGPMKRSYKILRGIFRNEFCRRIGAALHPRTLLGFGNWWSCHNRQRHPDATEPAYYMGADKEPQMIFAREYSKAHPEVDYYIMGHRHIAVTRPVPGSHATLTILGDCFRTLTYARFDGQNLHLEQNASASF